MSYRTTARTAISTSCTAVSLLMERVLAPRFTFTPKNKGPLPDFDYRPDWWSVMI